MTATLSPELYWLTATALLTAILWVPYIVQLIAQMGVMTATMDPYHETPHEARWAQRANAVENLAVLAPLAIAVHVTGGGTPLTAAACATYFAARVVHYFVYVLAIPLLRTISFAVGLTCQVILAARLLGWLG